MQLWILMHPELWRNAKIIALVRFLAEKLNSQKSMFIASKGSANPPAGT